MKMRAAKRRAAALAAGLLFVLTMSQSPCSHGVLAAAGSPGGNYPAFPAIFPGPQVRSFGQEEETKETPEELTQLYAQSAVLMDADSGRILFGKEETIPRAMASTTKIMTCILALESGQTEAVCTVSENAASQPEVHLGVRPGEQYRMQDLLYSLMLESHNDSAVVIAEAVGGSVGNFAAMMNEKAREIGCTDTHFVTPNGLDAEDEGGVHSATAADLARILRYCIQDSPQREAFLEITETRNYQFLDSGGGRSFSCTNHNAFLDMMDGALTGKTGFTADAGYCYVGALRRDERTFIVALLACGWPGNKHYKWSDTKKLMQYGIDHYTYQSLEIELAQEALEVQGGIPEGGIFGGTSSVGLRPGKDSLVALLDGTEEIRQVQTAAGELEAPVKSGEEVGQIQVLADGFLLESVPVETAASVEEQTYGWCLGELLNRFLNGRR